MVKKADMPRHVAACALSLAAIYGWRNVSLGEIAEEAGLSLADLRGLYASKAAILAGFTAQIDAAVLASKFDHGEDDSARDRLFDVLTRRFELLTPHKGGLAAVARECAGDPCAALCRCCGVLRSMTWMLEAAGIPSVGFNGRIRVKGLALIFASTLPVWLRDDSEDMARTMAVLDRRLARAESLAGMVWRGRRADGPAPEPPAAPATA